MKLYRVLWSETAQKELESVIEYIGMESPARARTLFQSIVKKAASLRHFPFRGRIVPELSPFSTTFYREQIITPWRLLYKITGNEVHVLGFLDSRRNLEEILWEKFLEK